MPQTILPTCPSEYWLDTVDDNGNTRYWCRCKCIDTVYIGFSGAAGATAARHRVSEFKFTNQYQTVEYNSFSKPFVASDFHLVGQAVVANNQLVLIPDQISSFGSAWLKQEMRFTDDSLKVVDFDVSYVMLFDTADMNDYADGICFVIQSVSSSAGGGGGGMGYAGVDKSIAVCYDIYKNTVPEINLYDLSNNEIELNKNGNIHTNLARKDMTGIINNHVTPTGAPPTPIYVWIEYRKPNITVYASTGSYKNGPAAFTYRFEPDITSSIIFSENSCPNCDDKPDYEVFATIITDPPPPTTTPPPTTIPPTTLDPCMYDPEVLKGQFGEYVIIKVWDSQAEYWVDNFCNNTWRVRNASNTDWIDMNISNTRMRSQDNTKWLVPYCTKDPCADTEVEAPLTVTAAPTTTTLDTTTTTTTTVAPPSVPRYDLYVASRSSFAKASNVTNIATNVDVSVDYASDYSGAIVSIPNKDGYFYYKIIVTMFNNTSTDKYTELTIQAANGSNTLSFSELRYGTSNSLPVKAYSQVTWEGSGGFNVSSTNGYVISATATASVATNMSITLLILNKAISYP